MTDGMARRDSGRYDYDSTVSLGESNMLLPPNPDTVPQDRLNFVYTIFYVLGIGTLLPWNFFSNAKDYFMYKLRNVTADVDVNNPDNQTELQIMFESYLSVAAMLPGVLFMFLNTVATKLVSLRLRMVSAGIVMIIMFGLTVVLVRIDTDSWQINFFAVTLVTIVIMNAGSAILQGGMFGLSGMFPAKYTQAVMGGMGMGGTLAAVANILAITISKAPLDQGFGYFLTALLVIVIALVGYLSLPYFKFARFHTKKTHEYQIDEAKGDVTVNEHHPILASGVSEVETNSLPNLSLWSILKRIWPLAFCVWITFCITLSCYPAVASAINSSDKSRSPWAKTYFTPVMCFLCFNVADLFGRTFAGFVQFPSEGSILLPIFCLIRLGFIPLFLFCDVEPRTLPVFFSHDAAPITFMLFFAVTNGYLGTVSMMYGPRRVPQEDVETAGAMMSFFLSLGLGTGSLFSFLLLKIVRL